MSPVLDIAEAKIEADGLGQQGQQGSLLQLVVQDGCVALAPAPISCVHALSQKKGIIVEELVIIHSFISFRCVLGRPSRPS